MKIKWENTLVLGGEGAKKLSGDVANLLQLPHKMVDYQVFPDSESLVTVPNVEGKEVIYIKSTPRPQAKNLIELFLTIDALKTWGAKKVHLVIPYYAHARQDKGFLNGQSISAETVAKLIASLDLDSIFTVDAHFHRDIGPYRLFSTHVKGFNISAVKRLAEAIKEEYKPNDPVIIIPDKGQAPTHDYIRMVFDTKFYFLHKTRLSPTEVVITCDEDITSFNGRDAIIFDDMISSGGTLIKSMEWLKERDVGRIFIAATHLMYPTKSDSEKPDDIGIKLYNAGAHMIITANTTNLKENGQISIAPLIANALKSQQWV